MKFKILILVLACLASCKSQSNLSKEVKAPIIQQAATSIEGYESTISLIPNKSLEFKTDEFNSVYAEESDGSNYVLKYELKKIQDPKLPDGRYSEIIYAELPANFSETYLKDGDLQTLKLHTAKFCFCENANSYQPITNGFFQLIKGRKDELTIRFDFKLKKGTQKITSLSEVIFIK